MRTAETKHQITFKATHHGTKRWIIRETDEREMRPKQITMEKQRHAETQILSPHDLDKPTQRPGRGATTRDLRCVILTRVEDD